MSEEIIENAAPTLAGLKTGSLFTVEYSDKKQILEEIREVNATLAEHGLYALPMRFSDRRVLIYIYRPKSFFRDLADPKVSGMLGEIGYPVDRPGACVSELRKRINREQSFPHEVGLFLGYPPEDVYGFINHRDSGCKCVGSWKVYGDENAARKKFEQYRKCTNSYIRRSKNGATLASLLINV